MFFDSKLKLLDPVDKRPPMNLTKALNTKDVGFIGFI
jgi:hypothetical protein